MSSKPAYHGRHAELYDLFYAQKPYAHEAAFVHQCLQQFGAPPAAHILELACGTGRHAREFAKLGYRVTATDYSPSMVAQAQQASAHLPAEQVRYLVADMRQLPDFKTGFDVAVCLFDAIGYVLSNQGVLQTLQSAHRCLSTGGLLVLEFWHAAAMLRSFEPTRVKRWPLPDKEIVRISETTLNVAQQTATVAYTIYELGYDGTYKKLTEIQQNRFFLLQEMQQMAQAAGFEPLAHYNGYTHDTTITGETWHIVMVLQKQ